MRCFWCILLAFCILSCGGNSAGPEPEPDPEPITDPEQKPEPKSEPEPQYKELSYENLIGSWVDANFFYSFGTRADSSFGYVHYPMMGVYENFSGKYFLNDPYIGIRGIFGWGMRREYPEDRYYLYFARLTDSIRVSGSMSDTISVLTLRSVPETYLRGILNLSDVIGLTPVVMSMSGEKFSSLLDSLKANTNIGRIIQTNNHFVWIRYGP